MIGLLAIASPHRCGFHAHVLFSLWSMLQQRLTPQHLWISAALVSDGLVILSSLWLGYALRSLSPHALLPLDIYLGLAGVCIVCFWGIQAALGGYNPYRLLSRFDEWVTVLVGLGLAFGLVLSGVFFIRSISLSRLVLGYAGILSLVGLTLSRAGLRQGLGWMRSRGWGTRRVLWVGDNPLLEDVVERLQRVPQLGFELVGWVGSAQEVPPDGLAHHLPMVTELTHLSDYLQTHPEIAEIWFAQPHLATADLLLNLQSLHRPPLQVRLLPDILAFLTVNFSLQLLDGIPLLTLQPPPLSYWPNRLLKRGLDIGGALLGLLCLSPLMLLIALGVKLTSTGAILYRQERISLNGQHFWIYKFRTMAEMPLGEGQPGWTQANDPRRTPLGILLRRLNLDELPQLWNVLMGDMSLVGPRPEQPYYVAQFSQAIPKYLDRHLVKSGLTGWAQIHGLRGDTSIPRRTQYDLYYVQNWSLLLDLRILTITLWRGITGQINGY